MLLPLKIKTEEKAKVLAAAWGAELIQFKDNMKNWMNSSLSSNHYGANM